MKAPARFIAETAERLREDADGTHMYKFAPMRLREIQDIEDSAEFIHLIARSISSVGETTTSPPATRYRPEATDLAVVVREMARLVLPLCKKSNLDNKRIVVSRILPNLHMDGGAAGRVFMNLIMNAVKYAQSSDPQAFRVAIESELLTIEELEYEDNGSLPDGYIHQAKALGIREGYLVTVSDYGIGIIGDDPQRVFTAGHREIGHVPFGATGAGLGLHVVRRIMEDHFGIAWVSRRSGPTEVSLFFPDLLFNGGYTQLPEWKGKTA